MSENEKPEKDLISSIDPSPDEHAIDDLSARIVGRVADYPTKKLTITSEFGTFVY